MKTYDRLISLVENSHKQEALSRHVSQLQDQVNLNTSELKKLQKKMVSEEKDVEDLESIGLKNAFYSFLGDKEEKIEKEKQEFIEASLKYNEKIKKLEILEYELSLLNKKLLPPGQLEAQVRELQALRQKEILTVPSGLRTRLEGVLDKVSRAKQYEVDLMEARDIGAAVDRHLVSAMNNIGKARNWGRIGMGNRGLRYAKERYMDIAKNEIYNASYKLNQLAAELNDIGISSKIHIDQEWVNGLTRTFFANIITDWMLNQKLEKTYSAVASQQKELRAYLAHISKEVEGMKSEMKALEVKRLEVIMTKP